MKRTKTENQIVEQIRAHGIEMGKRYRDPASKFEGVATSFYFYQHGCLRVCLRGQNQTTGEPADFAFDAPELVDVETLKSVPKGKRTGGPHDLSPTTRPGPQ